MKQFYVNSWSIPKGFISSDGWSLKTGQNFIILLNPFPNLIDNNWIILRVKFYNPIRKFEQVFCYHKMALLAMFSLMQAVVEV